MGRTKKSAAGADTGPPSTKKARTSAGAAAAAGAVQPARWRQQQQGIEAALAAQRTRVTTDLLLEQKQPHDELEHRLTDELNSNRDKYLQAWADKCHGLRNEAAGGSKMRGGSLRARRAAAAASSLNQEQTDLDQAALRYTEGFRHLLQQASKHDACFEPHHLETLVLILRSDVVHAVGATSHQAYMQLRTYLQRFPYASVGHFESGEFAGRPFLLVNQAAAWEPLSAMSSSLSKNYIFEEAIKDAGFNYRLDHSAAGTSYSMASAARKKGGLMDNTFQLLFLCFDRAVDSVHEDYNGDLLLLRYLLTLLQQDLRRRLEVFAAYADVKREAVQGRRRAVLQNALLWRIWTNDRVGPKDQQELLLLLMKLIVGVASEEDLQEVDEEHHQLDKEAEAAAPCICTPRELAALAATFLNMLLDLFGAAETAGGFAATSSNRMNRHNLRLRLDNAMRELFWKKPTGVCTSDASSRTFLAALAPSHRMRLLSLVAMGQVSRAYYAEEAQSRPAVRAAQLLDGMVKNADSGEYAGAFPADPLVALGCLNQDKERSIKVFSNVSGCSPINNLAVLGCSIALTAHTLLAEGSELPLGSGEDAGEGEPGSSGGSLAASAGRQKLRQELQEFLQFVAKKHKEARASGKAVEMSQASLCDLLHAQAALAAI